MYVCMCNLTYICMYGMHINLTYTCMYGTHVWNALYMYVWNALNLYMYVCMYIYIYFYISMHTYTHTLSLKYIYMHIHIHTYMASWNCNNFASFYLFSDRIKFSERAGWGRCCAWRGSWSEHFWHFLRGRNIAKSAVWVVLFCIYPGMKKKQK